ncbi:MAG: helix-turn-helix domain-containing protein [Acidobacteriota bacterium]|nr:helix-turn-helix domain-containing protein [Acidobacteriota bacterium]
MRAAATRPPRRRHVVAVVVYDGITPFELGVACDVFGPEWEALFDTSWYRLYVCGLSPRPVNVEGGFQVLPAHGPDRIASADTVVVLPTIGVDQAPAEMTELLRKAHARGARIVSLCTGAFVLAAARLLDGRKATTHWSECALLASRYPEVTVDPDVLFVDQGTILTSAGSAASMDLCLHLVRQDHGAEIATRLARQLVVPPQRSGGQAQYIATPLPALDESNLLAETVVWMQENLDQAITVEALAARSAMSPRSFARRFRAATGTTPYQWLLRQRVQLSQRLLETTDLSVEAIAERSGFSTASNLRKHFRRNVHTSPQSYRRTFQTRRAS